MKKLFAFLIVVFFAGFLLAQNTSTVNESGNFNTHMVDQTGSNTSTINQTAATGAANNHAFVTQNGIGNAAEQTQYQQPAITAPQNVTINQVGDDNTATQEQGFGYTGYNDATIEQLSSSNTGYQRQDGYNLTSDILQEGGNTNYAEQYQAGNHEVATATQNGAVNTSRQTQSGINHNATVMSVGDYNYAQQTQSGGTYNSPPTYLSGHTASINQKGYGNWASQNQSGLQNNHATIQQDGNQNNSTQNQAGSSNNSQVVIAGNNNTTLQDQKGNNDFSYFAASFNTHGNVMTNYQSGGDNNYNNSRIRGTGTAASDNNTIDITQSGNNNKSYNWIEGNDNSITTSQTGDFNESGTSNVVGSFGVYQIGDNNSATVMQAGTGFNHSQVSQIGNNNTGTVDQH